MELKELKIICNALWEYKRFCLEKKWEPPYDDYKEVQELMYKYDKKLYNKCKRWYLVIRWSWSWYSWQSNCDRWERWSWCKKMTQMSYCKAQYNKNYVQTFSDWTKNYRTINFEYDKPEVNNNLWWYEWRLRKQWLPV